MKKQLLILFLSVGLVVSGMAQGILLDNTINNNPSSAATSLGLVWTNDWKGHIGLFDGMNYNLGIEFYAGASSSSLTLLDTVIPGVGGVQYTGNDLGLFQRWPSTVYNVPGVSGGNAWVKLNVWWYELTPVNTYAAAVAAPGSLVASVLFQNPVGQASPPLPPQSLTGMPALILEPIPEPSVIALAGIGLASLLIFRRRK